MALGNPKLATLAGDDTLRIYEFSGGGFVQTVATALAFNHGVRPVMGFCHDGNILCTQYRDTGGNSAVITHDKAAVNKAFNYRPGSAYIVDWCSGQGVLLFKATDSSTNGLYGYVVASDGTLTAPTVTIPSFAASSSASNAGCISMSPDGQCILYGRFGGDSSYVISGAWPTFTSATAFPLSSSIGIKRAVWSQDSKLLFVGNDTDAVYVFRRDPATNAFSQVAVLGSGLGAAKTIAVSPDTRWVAVNFTGTTPKLYKRISDYFFEQTVSGIPADFGDELSSFLGGSDALVDSANKYALTLSADTWTYSSTPTSTLASAIAGAAANNDIASPTGAIQVYGGALERIFSALPASTMKLMLLGAGASFTSTHTTVAQVTSSGTLEVAGNGWPSGGKALTGVSVAPVSSYQTALIADPVTQIIVSAPLSFRYGLVYDTTDNKPLVFIDFQQSFSAERDTEMSITFGPDGLILLTP